MLVKTVQNGNKVVATARIGGTARQATVTVPEHSSDERKNSDAHAEAAYNLLKRNRVDPIVYSIKVDRRGPANYDIHFDTRD